MRPSSHHCMVEMWILSKYYGMCPLAPGNVEHHKKLTPSFLFTLFSPKHPDWLCCSSRCRWQGFCFTRCSARHGFCRNLSSDKRVESRTGWWRNGPVSALVVKWDTDPLPDSSSPSSLPICNHLIITPRLGKRSSCHKSSPPIKFRSEINKA